MRKILITNNGMEIRIVKTNNGQVVSDVIYGMTEHVRLMKYDCTIDYKHIAGILGTTEEKFKRNYKLNKSELGRIASKCGADWMLTYAEFTEKNRLEKLYNAIQDGDIKIADDKENTTMNNVIDLNEYRNR